MAPWLKDLREKVWPSRPRPGASSSVDGWALPLLLILIAVACGPDVFAYFELSALLDMLGVALFLLCFLSGVRLLLSNVGGYMQRAVGGPELVSLMSAPGPTQWRIYWGGLLTLRYLGNAVVALWLILVAFEAFQGAL